MQIGTDIPGRITRLPGGVAMNIAMALKAYGMRPALLCAIGRDDAGEELMRACDKKGMLTQYIYRSAELPTDQYMAVEGENGLIAAIADAHSLELAGDKILRPLTDGPLSGWDKMIALDGNLTLSLLTDIAASPAFAAADLRIAPASPGKADRLSAFLSHPRATLYLNLEEAGLLLNHSFKSSWLAAQALLEHGVFRVLVTDGPRTATVAIKDAALSLTPPEVTVTRITGAGDTFMAAHIAAEAQGLKDEASLQAALNAAATYISSESYR
jgi:sugar/nucleoside kinase (ribokinase family)